jgi:tetratricopeptide (TPR) repeat protein
MDKQIKTLYDLALDSYSSGDLMKSYNSLKDILQLSPDHIRTLTLIGVVSTQLSFIEEAKMYFIKIIRLDENYTNAYINLANLYQGIANFEIAKGYYLKAIELNPNSLATHNNLALSYKNNNDLINAKKYFTKALSIKENAITKYNLSLVYLTLGNYKKGFELFCSRYDETQIVDKIKILDRKKLLIKDINIENKTLLIYNEQGFGDMIQFIRFLPLIEKKCKKIILNINPLLEKLFKENYPQIKFIQSLNKIKYDYHLPLMELGYLLDIRYKNIPFSNKYLSINKNRSKKVFNNLFDNTKLKIGIIWKTNPAKESETLAKMQERADRSISLKLILKYINNKKYNLYSLQKGTSIEEEEILRANDIPSLGNHFVSFYDNALVIDNLDILIGIDTTSLILSGAMGKKTFVLLPLSTDWRWGTKNSKTNWYNSITLFRQKKYGKWKNELKSIATHIKDKIF